MSRPYDPMARPTFWESRMSIHNEAQALAVQLRREAIDRFWREAGASVMQWSAQAGASASRAANRLRQRIERHATQRQTLGG